MMVIKNKVVLAAAAAALILSGCSSTGSKDGGDGAGGAEIVDGGSGGAATSGVDGRGSWKGSPLDNPDSLLATRKVYFDFDRSEIRSEYLDVLRAHAEFLAANPLVNVTIEGHCDERGSREYNIGLGERRSNAVKRFFEAEGVNASQINTISYGEERPEDDGHNEAAWAQNRRAILVY